MRILQTSLAENDMKDLTVLTPAFNRRKALQRLYDSLLSQTDKNFEWLIIDDGSTDDTSQFVHQWLSCNEFSVRYYKKENGGKHTALNYALDKISTTLVFIVDSDDYLTPDAVETIYKKFNTYKSEKDLCGFSFLRIKPDGSGYLSPKLPKDDIKSTYCECRINGELEGDMAEVWYTDKLREFPFPEFEGEKFLGEDTVWVKISGKYKMRFFNKAIYVSDYLGDGLTLNRRRHNINSPNGCVARAEAFLNSDIDLKYKIKSMLQYFIYGRFAGKDYTQLLENSQNKLLAFLCMFPSAIIYTLWKNKFCKSKNSK